MLSVIRRNGMKWNVVDSIKWDVIVIEKKWNVIIIFIVIIKFFMVILRMWMNKFDINLIKVIEGDVHSLYFSIKYFVMKWTY